jgi:indolepyruvate ferredoxin oxidoreductase beta subunit
MAYPGLEEIRKALEGLAKRVIFIKATEEAVKLGNPILSNIIMIGSVIGLGLLPLGINEFMATIEEALPKKHLDVNVRAFKIGRNRVISQANGKQIAQTGKKEAR